MRRGTTTTHTFTVSPAIPEGSLVRLVYAQKPSGIKKVLFVKTGKDVTVSGNSVTTKLTQEETLAVDDRLPVLAQVRMLTPENEALSTDVITISAKECLEDEVMAFEGEW